MSILKIQTYALLGLLVFLAACGGKEEVASISPENQYAALPSGALMVYSISPTAIRENPLMAKLINALGKSDEEIIFSSAARQAGVDPAREVDRMDWGLYGIDNGIANWGMILRGSFQEEKILGQFQSDGSTKVEEKTYLKQTYYQVSHSGRQSAMQSFLRFPEPGVAIATSNEAIMQKSIVVAKGRAEGMDSDERLAPILKEVATESPAWFAGLAQGTLERLNLTVRFSRGENLGRGIKSYHGQMTLSPERINFNAVFEADNAEAAQRQAANYDAIKVSQAQGYTPILGQAAVNLANQIELTAEEAKILVSMELTAEEVDTVSTEIDEALRAGSQLPEMLRQQLQSATMPASE